jgi:hypothetical protein
MLLACGLIFNGHGCVRDGATGGVCDGSANATSGLGKDGLGQEKKRNGEYDLRQSMNI